MSRFYLTLPSNSSMQYYPDNTAARFTTKLDNTVELEGDWEVGLLEISTPLGVVNVAEGSCYYVLYHDRKYHSKILLPSAHHHRISDLINTLHEEQRTQTPIHGSEPLMVQFEYMYNNRIFIKLDPGTVFGDVAIRFSPDLARILGFDAGKRYATDKTAPRPTTLDVQDIFSVYVYCDLLEHIVVGDTKAPLLRIVDKPQMLRRSYMHTIFNPILYVPLQKKNFDTVEIDIMTDTGKPVPFVKGKSFVVLEVRRAVHPYFAL